MSLDYYKAIDFILLSYQVYNEAHFADFKFQVIRQWRLNRYFVFKKKKVTETTCNLNSS